MHTETAPLQTTFPSYPTMAWLLAAPVFMIAILFVIATVAHQPDEHFRAAALISVIMPVFLGSAAWLATRPAYKVWHDSIGGTLELSQTWPVRRTILAIRAPSIVAIDVRPANRDDGLAWSVVATLADQSEVSLSAEIVSRASAERLTAALRKTMAL